MNLSMGCICMNWLMEKELFALFKNQLNQLSGKLLSVYHFPSFYSTKTTRKQLNQYGILNQYEIAPFNY